MRCVEVAKNADFSVYIVMSELVTIVGRLVKAVIVHALRQVQFEFVSPLLKMTFIVERIVLKYFVVPKVVIDLLMRFIYK